MYVQGVSTRKVAAITEQMCGFAVSSSQVSEATAELVADWMEENLPEGLTVFAFPAKHRRLIRTTNGLERLNREIRRSCSVPFSK